MIPLSVSLLMAAFALAWALAQVIRRRALAANRLDVPNERSMHSTPTPRGGGAGFVVAILLAAAGLAVAGRLQPRLALALVPAGTVVAVMGWFDDRTPLSNRFRMPIWLAAAAWAVAWLGGLPALRLGTHVLGFGWVGLGVGVVGVVWILNLYNFMDGTDGLAGTQAVMAAGVGSALLASDGAGEVALLMAVVAASVTGFLVSNWPPARIFMGDVGSGFLGFVFAGVAIWSEAVRPGLLLVWAVLLGVFIVDATLTVARRMVRREPWGQAHRSHAYQVLARRSSHRAVLLGFIGVQALLSLAALACWTMPDHAPAVAGAAFLLLGAGWAMVVFRLDSRPAVAHGRVP